MTNANLINTVQSHIREFRKNLPKDIKQIFTVVCHTEIAEKLTGGNTDGEWYIGAYQSDPENNPLDLSHPYVVNISSTSDHRMPKNSVYVHVKSEGEEETPTNPLTFENLNTHGVSEHTKPLVFDEQFEERQFNNQIGKSMLSVIMLAKSMSRLKEKAEKLKAIKPLKPEKKQAHSHCFGKDFDDAIGRVVALAQKANEEKCIERLKSGELGNQEKASSFYADIFAKAVANHQQHSNKLSSEKTDKKTHGPEQCFVVWGPNRFDDSAKLQDLFNQTEAYRLSEAVRKIVMGTTSVNWHQTRQPIETQLKNYVMHSLNRWV